MSVTRIFQSGDPAVILGAISDGRKAIKSLVPEELYRQISDMEKNSMLSVK
jgi:hypothetical protein